MVTFKCQNINSKIQTLVLFKTHAYPDKLNKYCIAYFGKLEKSTSYLIVRHEVNSCLNNIELFMEFQ